LKHTELLLSCQPPRQVNGVDPFPIDPKSSEVVAEGHHLSVTSEDTCFPDKLGTICVVEKHVPGREGAASHLLFRGWNSNSVDQVQIAFGIHVVHSNLNYARVITFADSETGLHIR
jgi:hypothetical protein